MDFAYRLLEEQHVAVVPGITYGERYRNYIRIAFTHDSAVLLRAVDCIAAFLSSVAEKSSHG
jgi:aspartate/methionine/tyrosine aminotransferase